MANTTSTVADHDSLLPPSSPDASHNVSTDNQTAGAALNRPVSCPPRLENAVFSAKVALDAALDVQHLTDTTKFSSKRRIHGTDSGDLLGATWVGSAFLRRNTSALADQKANGRASETSEIDLAKLPLSNGLGNHSVNPPKEAGVSTITAGLETLRLRAVSEAHDNTSLEILKNAIRGLCRQSEPQLVVDIITGVLSRYMAVLTSDSDYFFMKMGLTTSAQIRDRKSLSSFVHKVDEDICKRKTWTQNNSWSKPLPYFNIVPSAISEVVQDRPGKCVAKWPNGKYCNEECSSVPGRLSDLLRDLAVSLRRDADLRAILSVIHAITSDVYCKKYHKPKADVRLEKLFCHFLALARGEHKSAKVNDLTMFEKWLFTFLVDAWPSSASTPRHVTTLPSSDSGINPQSPQGGGKGLTLVFPERGIQLSADDDKLIVEDLDAKAFGRATHLNHKHFQKWKYERESTDLIAEILRKGRTRADRVRFGYIYVFWHKGSFGYVKIGYTGSIPKRLAEWEAQCGYSDLEELSDKLSSPRQVPEPRIVEDLIHAELQQWRREEMECSGCGGKHIEWFEVSSDFAQRVVQKWTHWARDRQPFDIDGQWQEAIQPPELDATPSETSSPRSARAIRQKQIDLRSRSQVRSFKTLMIRSGVASSKLSLPDLPTPQKRHKSEDTRTDEDAKMVIKRELSSNA